METTNKWMRKMCHICTMAYSPDVKKNKVMNFAHRWMELEKIVSNEVLFHCFSWLPSSFPGHAVLFFLSFLSTKSCFCYYLLCAVIISLST